MPSALIVLILFMAGLISGIGIGLKWRIRPAAPPPVDAAPVVLSARAWHDLNAPLKLILGYCALWLNPGKGVLIQLPIAMREDLTSIARNSQQLQALIDQMFIEPGESAPERADTLVRPNILADPPVSARTVIVLHPDPLAVDWLSRHLPNYHIIWTPTLAELARLPADQPSISLIIAAPDDPNLAGITALLGNQIPILRGILPGTAQAAAITRKIRYLGKPITYEHLITAFASFSEPTSAPIKTILIIDDHQDSVAMLDRLLIEIAPTYTIWKAYSGREGMTLLYEQPPDIVILDYYLPDMDGLTITQIMQIDPRLAHIPILLTSARRDSDNPIDFALPIQLSLIKLNGFKANELITLLETLITFQQE